MGLAFEKSSLLRLTLNKPFFKLSLPGLVFILILVSNYLVFTVVPNERVMGAVQRIFYFHVGAAIAAYFMLALLFIGSVCYLATRKPEFDALSVAGASVAFLMCSIVLGTGIIWGHSAWNTWWRWEPRLVSVLILWLLLLGYTVLRSTMKNHSSERRAAAVVGILAAVQVPIVMFSVKLIDHTQQLHPQSVTNQGLEDPSYVWTLVLSIVTISVFSFWLASLKFSQELLAEVIRDRG